MQIMFLIILNIPPVEFVIGNFSSAFSSMWNTTVHLSSRISSASMTSFRRLIGSSPPVYPGPQRRTLARSLPVPKGTMAQAGLSHSESCPTLSRHCNTQPIVPSPPHTRILYRDTCRKTYNLPQGIGGS